MIWSCFCHFSLNRLRPEFLGLSSRFNAWCLVSSLSDFVGTGWLDELKGAQPKGPRSRGDMQGAAPPPAAVAANGLPRLDASAAPKLLLIAAEEPQVVNAAAQGSATARPAAWGCRVASPPLLQTL